MKDSNLTEHAQRIKAFMTGIGYPMPDKPEITNDEKLLKLRILLIFEELLEFIEASGFEIIMGEQVLTRWGLKNDCEITSRTKPNLIKMVDALADISTVTIGSLLALGVEDKPILEEVDKNNMLKINTGHKCPKTGKWKKCEGHKSPNIKDLIQNQINNV